MNTTEKTFYALYAPEYDKFLSWKILRNSEGIVDHVSHAGGCGGTGWLSNKPGRMVNSVDDGAQILQEMVDFFASDDHFDWGFDCKVTVVKVTETRTVEAA